MARARTLAPPPRGGIVPLAALVALLFAASGAASLALQVVWTRWLTLVLGSTTHATVLVLAVFMGGLGLGAALAGRLVDRRPTQGLMLFAGAEVLVAGWSLASIPLLTEALPALAAGLASEAGELPSLPLAARALLAALALAPPTLLMGATLPFLVRWAVEIGGLAGREGADLYALNTLGGAAGALAAPFVLVEALGLAGTALTAAATDLGVGLVAALLAWRVVADAPAADEGAGALPIRGEEGALPSAGLSRAERRRRARAEKAVGREPAGPALESAAPGAGATSAPAADAAAALTPTLVFALGVLGFAVSGLVGLGLEVVAHRVIAVLSGSSAYAHAVMLAGFLAGIGFGSLVGARIAERLRHPALALGLTLSGLALGTGLAASLFASGAWRAVGRAAEALPLVGGTSYGGELFGCLVLLLPATLFLGLALPFVARLAALAPAHLGGRLGLAYGLNTLGAVLGAVLAGLVLVPALGSGATLVLLTAAAALTGLAIVLMTAPRARVAPAAIVALVAGGAGVGMAFGADPVREHLLARFDPRSVLAFDEGPVQTIAVIDEQNFQQGRFLRLVTNQTSLTGTHLYAQRYMGLLGHLPAIWAQEPERGLVICLGTGMTVAAAATHPEIERLDVAEISRAVSAAAPLFREASRGVLDDPRVHLAVEDGRHVMLASPEPWDFLTLEPPPPRDSGVVSLYSTDFYELALERLDAGGVVAQWIPLHSQSEDELKMLVASFVELFPHVLGFMPVERELLLLGAPAPLARSEEALRARITDPEADAALDAIGIPSLASLLATAVADRERLELFSRGAPLVSDDRPRVEYFAQYGRRPTLPDVSSLIEDPLPLEALVAGQLSDALREDFAREREALFVLLEAAWNHERRESEAARGGEARALRLAPDNEYYRWAAMLSDRHLDELRAQAAAAGAPASWLNLVREELRRGRFDEAADAFARALEVGNASPPEVQALMRQIFAGLPPEEREPFWDAIRADPEHPALAGLRQILEQQQRRGVERPRLDNTPGPS